MGTTLRDRIYQLLESERSADDILIQLDDDGRTDVVAFWPTIAEMVDDGVLNRREVGEHPYERWLYSRAAATKVA